MSTLAFALAATIKHDGHGGIADLLSTPADTARWLSDHQDLIDEVLGPNPGSTSALGSLMHPNQPVDLPNLARPHGGEARMAAREPEADGVHGGEVRRGADESCGGEVGGVRVWEELVGIRGAVRAVFARAVAPGPPSKADADRLMGAEAAIRMLNGAAARLGSESLEWPEGGEPVVRWAGGTDDPIARLIGAVGRSAIEFLVSPDRMRLRACPAARCVKYFLQDDPRQRWCSPSCGNRERVNRHYRKRAGR